MAAVKSFLPRIPKFLPAVKILLSASALSLTACQNDNMSAPYVFGGIGSRNLSEKPVTTELHTYDRDFAPEERFRRIGPPLKLTFPMKSYALLDNLSGGPQLYVRLRLDGPTLRSEVDVVRERYAGKTWEEKARLAYGGGVMPNYQFGQYRDGMIVQIEKREAYTDRFGRRMLVGYPARDVTEQFLKDQSETHPRKVGQYCGFDIYDQVLWREVDDRPASKAAALDRVIKGEGSFTGINREKDASLLSIDCGDKLRLCTAYIRYRGFGITASVDRRRVCDFVPSFNALPRFIDQHAAYPMPRESWPPPPPPPPSMGGPLIVGGKKFTL